MKLSSRKIVVASWVSLTGNALLALVKLIIGFISGSFAVIADGIDSATDIISSIVILIASKVVSRPPNIKFPYGYVKADTVATKVLSMFIFLAGSQLAISTVDRLINQQNVSVPTWIAVYVTTISIVGKYCLSIYLKYIGKNQNNNALFTMGINMRNDMLVSFTVLLGLLTAILINFAILDKIVALIISFFIMYEAITIFLKSNTELMDGLDNPDLYQQLFESVKKVEGAHNPHRTRARKIGPLYMINLDIEVDPDKTVSEAHIIAKSVEDRIKNDLENVYDVMVHIEPRGNLEMDEKFGISEKYVLQTKKKKE